jgi:preprotein translocase subunit YajC
MKLISDAMAQTEQPAPAPAEPAATPAPPAAKAEQAPAPAAPSAPPTKTGTAAPGAPAPGQTELPGFADLFAQIVPFLVIIGIVYIVVIRPQQRKQKEAETHLRNVRRGDVVVVNGFIGRVTKVVDDAEFEFEPGPNLKLRALLSAISEVRSRGEPIKDAPPPAKPTKESGPGAKPLKGAATAVKPARDAAPAAKPAKDEPPPAES